MRPPLRVANASGFLGDRFTAFAEMAADHEIDVITGDYLAEVTMFVLAKLRSRQPDAGYASPFLAQVRSALDHLRTSGAKVVVNAGGLNPEGLVTELRAMLREEGAPLRVAAVIGDDVVSDVRADGTWPHAESGAPLSSWSAEPITANAYLGGWGVAQALGGGADVVVCGRVADASLVVGAAAWWHGWTATQWNELAGALVAGHVIECGTQATGGNYSGFGFLSPFVTPGFPIAEIQADGSAVITKSPGTEGAVTVDTVTAQLLYEIQGVDYLNADVTAHLDSVRLSQDGPDRVRVLGVDGGPPPTHLKVAVTGVGGWRNSVTFVLTGLDIEAKQALLEAQVVGACHDLPELTGCHIERISHPAREPQTQGMATSLVRVTAVGSRESAGRAFSQRMVGICLSSVPGLYLASPPGDGSTYGVYWPTRIHRHRVRHQVVLDDGRRLKVPDPPQTVERQRSRRVPAEGGVLRPESATDLTRLPLGRIVQARSGDKGGNANLGLWVRDEAAWPWLRSTLTSAMLRALVPELADLRLDRVEFPHLKAVHFLVHGLLDGGATSTSRFDNQAKALGEYVRACWVDAPTALATSDVLEDLDPAGH